MPCAAGQNPSLKGIVSGESLPVAVIVITTVSLDHCVACGAELAVMAGPEVCRTCRLGSGYLLNGSLVELIGGMAWHSTVVVVQVDGRPAEMR